MPTRTSRSSHVCPKCHLSLTVIRTEEGITVEYDIAEWGRTCHHPSAGTPLACPEVQTAIRGWLRLGEAGSSELPPAA